MDTNPITPSAIVEETTQATAPQYPSTWMAVQATTDDALIDLWLHGRSPCTRRAYGSDIAAFRRFVGVELRLVTLRHVQSFADSLKSRAEKSQARTIAAVRSLLSFAQKVGFTHFNTGAALRPPKVKNRLAERILPESDVLRMLALETNPRNRALFYFLYDTGARVSEATGLVWADVRADGASAVVTLLGKGGKTRFNRITPTTWKYLEDNRTSLSSASDAVFASRKGHGHLDPSRVDRVVRSAAVRAGIDAPASAHWLRHAHASHAINRGAKLHEITAQLGHSSAAVTSVYLHVNPEESSSRYLAI